MGFLIRLLLVGGSAAAFAFGPPQTHPLALVLVPVVAGSSFWQMWGLVAFYYSIAHIPVLIAFHDFSGSLLGSLMVYGIICTTSSLVMGVAFSRRGAWNLVAVPLAIVLLSLPPLSDLTPASWIPIAGALFPGTGTVGIVLLLICCVGLSIRPKSAAALLMLLSVSGQSHADSRPLLIAGVDTNRPLSSEIQRITNDQLYKIEDWQKAQNSNALAVVFPESNFGEIREGVKTPIYRHSKNVILGGARVYRSKSTYENVLVDAVSGQILAGQLRPIPYLPNDPVKAVKSNYGNTFNLMEWRIGAVFCIEASNVSVNYRLFSQPNIDAVVWIANVAWLKHPFLEKRISSQIQMWGRLYSVPVVTAVNRHV